MRPRYIAYARLTKMLWVADGDFRYIRFKLESGRYIYHDSFNAPTTWSGTLPNLIVQSADRYWATGRTLGPIQDMRTAMLGTARIKLVDLEEGILRQFGPFWEVDDDSPWSLLDFVMLNAGYLYQLNDGRLAWVWSFRPIIEVWSEEGVLLAQREFDDRRIVYPKRTGRDRVGALSVMACGAYDKEADLFFVRNEDFEVKTTLFMGLDTNTLEEKERYCLTIPGLEYRADPAFGGIEIPVVDNLAFMPQHYIVDRIDGEMRFYTIDQMSNALMILFPEKN